MRFEKGLLLKANTYYFDSIDEFNVNRLKIKTTPHELFSLSERRTMAGLAYVIFLHRMSFNLEKDGISANIADVRGGENIINISLSNLMNDGVPLGHSRSYVISQTREGKMTLGRAKLIYKPGSIDLFLDSFEHYDKMRDRRHYKGGGFDLPDRMGFS